MTEEMGRNSILDKEFAEDWVRVYTASEIQYETYSVNVRRGHTASALDEMHICRASALGKPS